jgi:hypothetical protein
MSKSRQVIITRVYRALSTRAEVRAKCEMGKGKKLFFDFGV